MQNTQFGLTEILGLDDMWIVMAVFSIVYFFAALIAIKSFGWAGLAGIWLLGMAIQYAIDSKGEGPIDYKWILVSPLALFFVGGIAGSIAILPFQILGIVPSSSHYISDDDFWSHR